MLSINDSDALEEDLDPDDFSEWTKRGPVGRLHNLVVWVNRSNKATGILRKLQEDDPDKNYPGTLDVILDNSTRWLSQYHMIERALSSEAILKSLYTRPYSRVRNFQGHDLNVRAPRARCHRALRKIICLRMLTGMLSGGLGISLRCLTFAFGGLKATDKFGSAREVLKLNTA